MCSFSTYLNLGLVHFSCYLHPTTCSLHTNPVSTTSLKASDHTIKMQVSKRKSSSKTLKEKKKKSSEDHDVASSGKEVIQNPGNIGEIDSLDDVDEDEECEEAQGDDVAMENPRNGDNKCTRRKVTYGSHMVRGKMAHGMEDYVVAKTKTVNGNELGLFAIFDGHSGRDVAEYLQNNLFNNILNEDDFWPDPEMAVKRVYKSTDDEILDKVVGSRGGSTAVTAMLINRERLVVANVGDSRGILCKRRAVEQITIDHEPESEKELVESKGGFVSQKTGNVPRVDGQLAMTRAFGDGKLKEHITSEPDVRVEKIDEDSKFVVLASDGIWKVMSNEDVWDGIEDMDDAQEAAEELVKMALTRGSFDDISCVVVMFN